jgi:hypothetical protein
MNTQHTNQRIDIENHHYYTNYDRDVLKQPPDDGSEIINEDTTPAKCLELIEQFIGDTEPIQPQLKKYSNHQPEVIDLNQLKRAYNLAVHHIYLIITTSTLITAFSKCLASF